MPSEFYKKEIDDEIWWVENNDEERAGKHLFTFDKTKIYNLFEDYPYNMTEHEVMLFDKENPFWANFFEYRNN
ncbi:MULTISPECIES: DUF7675 family protein [Streptococcus]|uniref:DUF7675 family protein n=1 Tax=Streptococcus TaxID=1301 RepID=UPI00373E7904